MSNCITDLSDFAENLPIVPPASIDGGLGCPSISVNDLNWMIQQLALNQDKISTLFQKRYNTLADAVDDYNNGCLTVDETIYIENHDADGDGGDFHAMVEEANSPLYPDGLNMRPIDERITPQVYGNDYAAWDSEPNLEKLIPVGVFDFTADITLDSEIIFDEGGIIRPASGITVTLSEPPRAGVYQIFDMSLGGKVKIKSPCKAHVDWFGPISRDSAAPNDTVPLAFECTARGTEIQVTGLVATTPIKWIADEDNPLSTSNRDVSKSLVGIGGPGIRLTPDSPGRIDYGAELILGDNQNDHLIEFIGVKRGNNQPSRFSATINNIKLHQNGDNQSAGCGIYGRWWKDINLVLVLVERAWDCGVRGDPSESGNQFYADMLEIMLSGRGVGTTEVDWRGDGFFQGGMGDAQIQTIRVGAAEGMGMRLQSGMTVGQARVYLTKGNAIQISGHETSVADARINDCGRAAIAFTGTSRNSYVQRLHSKKVGTDSTASGPTRSHVYFVNDCLNCSVGSAHFDNSTPAVHNVAFADSGGFAPTNCGVRAFTYQSQTTTEPVWASAGIARFGGNFAIPTRPSLDFASSTISGGWSITPSDALAFFVTLDGNQTINPVDANMILDGQKLDLTFVQDSIGGHTVNFHSSFLPTTALDLTPQAPTRYNFIAFNGQWIQE